jgi:hypothetical protein
VILYHFTNASHRAILKNGLKAKRSKDYWMLPHLPPCVWFTSRPLGIFTREPRKIRLTVSLAATDKNLVSWPDWLRLHAPDVLRVFRSKLFADDIRNWSNGEVKVNAWRYWWLYFGNLPAKSIEGVHEVFIKPEIRRKKTKQSTKKKQP